MKRLFLASVTLATCMPEAALGQVHNIGENCNAPNIDQGVVLTHCRAPDEIVTVGDRIGTSQIDDLTSPVSVLSEKEIQARNNAHLSDLLRSLPGVSVSSSGPAGNLTQLRLRGSEANHVLVLIDGVESSNPNTGEFDFAGLRAEDIRKIEVLRGEQSALYGSDAVGGVINIITLAGDVREGMRLSIEAGSRGTLDTQVSAVVPIKGAALSVNTNLFKTEGYDISGLGGEADASKSHNVNVGLNNVKLGALSISGKVGVSRLESEFDSGFPRLENSNDELITDTVSARADARFDVLGFDNLLTVSVIDVETVSPNASFRNDTRGKRHVLNWAAKKKLGEHHALTILAETEKETFTNFGGDGAGQNQTQSTRNEAIAADYRFDNDVMTLTASARQDFNDRFKDEATWRVGAGYAFENIDGRFRASVGTGVKNPTLTELFGFFPAFFVGNPDVKPERSFGYNIGYEQSLLGSDLNLSIDYFHSDLENEIFTDFAVFPSTARNQTTDSTREGVELEGRWNISKAINLMGSATFLKASENGIKEIRRPEFLASATATWRASDRLTLTGSIDHNGSQTDSDFATFLATNVTLSAYTLVGLNIAYKVNDIVTLTLRGDNLLDENYQEVVGYASQGRGIYGGLRANF